MFNYYCINRGALYTFIHMKKWIVIFIVVIMIAVGAVVILWQKLPYKNAAARQVTALLEKQGIPVKLIQVDYLSANKAVLKDIELGAEEILTIKQIDVSYNPLSQTLTQLEIKGLTLNVYQKNNAWVLGGLEGLIKSPTPETAPTELPLTQAALAALLLPQSLKITESVLNVKGKALKVTMPFEASYEHNPAPTLKFISTNGAIEQKPYTVNMEPLSIMLALDEAAKIWSGTIQSPKVNVAGFPQPLPEAGLEGSFIINHEKTSGDFRLKTAGEEEIKIALDVPIAAPEKALLTVKRAVFPWGGGLISAKSVKVPLAMDRTIDIALQLDGVDVEALLSAASQGKVQGSGKMSGVLPITYYPDGKIVLGEGGAQAIESGTISLSPDALPAQGGAELDVLKAALQNFHYTSLKIKVSSDAGDKSLISLALEGQNPDAFEGRPVKLNVNLTGDILPLIQQSLLPMNDFRQLLHAEDKQ